MTDTERAALRAAAENATPGPWSLGLTRDEIRMVLGGDNYVCHVQIHQTPRACGEWLEPKRIANAVYIASAHPAALLALLAENERMREALKGIVDQSCETFHINPVGGPNITVEGGDRFAHERDVRALVVTAKAALSKPGA